jgi:endonuclease/exonuclease/phosphatase family metal-dependent hydrolase
VRIRVLSWNLFHGRDFPPDPALFTLRSRLFRIAERNATHVQVNRDLLDEFAAVLAGADWDIALLQESPPRWAQRLGEACDAATAIAYTSRNTLGAVRAALARINPDLIASNEGGSNLTLVRRQAGAITETRTLVLRPGPSPERRTMVFTALDSGLRVANLHASTNDELATQELMLAAERSLEWSGESPLILGGDFNIRPRQTDAFDHLVELGFSHPTDPNAIDHLLVRGLEVTEPPIAWLPQRRELPAGERRLRPSDHAPVQAAFRSPRMPAGTPRSRPG